MSIAIDSSAFVVGGGQAINLSALASATASAANPQYLVLSALDRNEYPAGATSATGTLTGNGHTLSLSSIGGDGRGAGIVFTYQASTGSYYNSTYGYLDQLTYTSSGSLDDVTSLSFFGSNNLSQANSYASNSASLIQVDASGYLGSVTVATQPSFVGPVAAQATPDSIATTALSFVGKAWNMNGCWVLASTIAAEAGASLPVSSTLVGVPGSASGEWIVAYDGPAGQSGNWQSMVKAGEMVAFVTSSGGGHITTCVSGSGSTAMLVDNITYVYSNGQIANSANDGSANDVLIAAPHAVSQEFAGVSASNVVIYELDTPVVSNLVATDGIAFSAKQTLSALFSSADPANKAVTEYQVYDTATTDSLTVNGTTVSAHSATTAATASSLSSVCLVTGSTACTDTVEVRAFNGTYWGDWEPLAVTVAGAGSPAPSSAPLPPVLAVQTPSQSWTIGEHVSFALPAGTFTDPNGQTLTYTAAQSNGQALPSWLSFNAATETFTGTVPTGTQSFGISVKATDTSGLSITDTFAVTVPASAPIVAHLTPNQLWNDGQHVSFTLPANTFVDPQGETLSYTAYQVGGSSVVSWLGFNAKTDTFVGAVPRNMAGTVTLEVVAKDTGGLTATDIFNVTFGQASGHLAASIELAGVVHGTVHSTELFPL